MSDIKPLAEVFIEFLKNHNEVTMTEPLRGLPGGAYTAEVQYGSMLGVRLTFGARARGKSPGSSPAGDAVNANAGMRVKRKAVRKQ